MNSNSEKNCIICPINQDNPVKTLISDCVKEVKSGIQVGYRALNILNFSSSTPLINRLALCGSSLGRFAFNGAAMVYSLLGSILRLLPGKFEDLGSKMASDLTEIDSLWDQKEASLDKSVCAQARQFNYA